MTVYLVGYDLHEGEDYEDLISAIKEEGTWWHCLDSTWLVKSDKSALDLCNDLVRHVKNSDKLLVIKYGSDAAWYGFKDSCDSWLTNNL